MTESKKTNDKLYVLWTTRDRETALNMVFMYTLNSKLHEWWDEVCLIVWGPSAKLLSEDKELQGEIAKMKEAGVELLACKACSDRYEVTEKLRELGIEVIYMGEPLTRILKDGYKIITI